MNSRVFAISIVDGIAADLRNRLFDGSIAVDAQLTEADVSASYDVARPTAKAAIEKLVGEGLLLRGPHKTARVPIIGPDGVRDLYFARLCIESEVVRRLAERADLPAEVERANREVVRRARLSEPVNVVTSTLDFHFLLVSRLGSPRLERLFSVLMGEMRLCMVQMQARGLMRPRDVAAEHDEIIKRIKNGDPAGAVEALEMHFARAEQRLVPHLERESASPASQQPPNAQRARLRGRESN